MAKDNQAQHKSVNRDKQTKTSEIQYHWKEPEPWFLEIDHCDTPGLQGRPLLLHETDPLKAESKCIEKCNTERLHHALHGTAMCTFERDNLDCWYHDLHTIKNPPKYEKKRESDDGKLFVFGDPLLGQQLMNNTACGRESKKDAHGCTMLMDGWKRCPIKNIEQSS